MLYQNYKILGYKCFDFDGTLVDTNKLKFNCIIRTLKNFASNELCKEFTKNLKNKFIYMRSITRKKKFIDLLSYNHY